MALFVFSLNLKRLLFYNVFFHKVSKHRKIKKKGYQEFDAE